MTFVSPGYPLFLLGVVALHRLAPAAWRGVVLLVGSAVFYGWGHPGLLVLVVAIGASDQAIARAISAGADRRALVALAVGKDLGILGLFKYGALFAGLPVWVPLGLSFYALQSLGYVLDVAHRRVEARRSLAEALEFVLFFPQLVAGPVERTQDLAPQLAARGVASESQLRAGLVLLAWGAFQKIAVADTLDPWVDRAFALRDPGGPVAWAAAAAFMVQVYADLSGYTDLARGSALLFGIRLSKNFDAPWRAATTPEFWSRWHRTVTRFVREHLLAPLLGSGSPTLARRAMAVGVALLAMGAWHGAGWNFLIFGLLHATASIGYLLLEPWSPWRRPAWRPWFALGHLLTVGWLGAMIFREPDPGRLVAHLARPVWSGTADEGAAGLALFGLAAGLAVPLWLGQIVADRWSADHRAALPLQIVAVSGLLAACFVFWRPTDADFLYFQF